MGINHQPHNNLVQLRPFGKGINAFDILAEYGFRFISRSYNDDLNGDIIYFERAGILVIIWLDVSTATSDEIEIYFHYEYLHFSNIEEISNVELISRLFTRFSTIHEYSDEYLENSIDALYHMGQSGIFLEIPSLYLHKTNGSYVNLDYFHNPLNPLDLPIVKSSQSDIRIL